MTQYRNGFVVSFQEAQNITYICFGHQRVEYAELDSWLQC